MAEENKEQKKDETPKVEAASKPAEEAKAEKKPAAEAPVAKKKEKPSTCAVCNKSIKKKRYYYRNGKNFCTKRCWKTTVKKEEKAAENTKPEDAKDQAPSA